MPGCDEGLVRSRRCGESGSFMLATASCAAVGLDTSLARMAASSVIFIPVMCRPVWALS